MITKKICSKCGSNNVVMISKGPVGTWKCQDCGFVGNMIDKPVVGREIKEDLDLFGGKK